MTFNKVKQTYLIGGVAILVLVLVSWLFLVSPRMAQADEIGAQRAQIADVNAKAKVEIAKLTTMKAGLGNERKRAAALAVKFPPTADEPELFRLIVAAAVKAGIAESNVTSLGPAAPVLGAATDGAKLPSAGAKTTGGAGTGNLATMTVSFNAKGTYPQMVAMLKNLEDLPRSFLIGQVNLSSPATGESTLDVQGYMYMYKAISDPDAKPVAKSPTTSTPAVTPTQPPKA